MSKKLGNDVFIESGVSRVMETLAAKEAMTADMAIR